MFQDLKKITLFLKINFFIYSSLCMGQCNNVLNESKTFIHCKPCVINFGIFLWQLNINYLGWLCAIISMKYFSFNKSTIMFLHNIHEHIIFILEKYVSFIYLLCRLCLYWRKKTQTIIHFYVFFQRYSRYILKYEILRYLLW